MENLMEIKIYKDDIDNAKNYFKSNNIDNKFIHKISLLTEDYQVIQLIDLKHIM